MIQYRIATMIIVASLILLEILLSLGIQELVLGNILKFNRIMIVKHYRVWNYAPQ